MENSRKLEFTTGQFPPAPAGAGRPERRRREAVLRHGRILLSKNRGDINFASRQGLTVGCRIYPDGFCAAKAAATSISLHGKDLRWDVAFTRTDFARQKPRRHQFCFTTRTYGGMSHSPAGAGRPKRRRREAVLRHGRILSSKSRGDINFASRQGLTMGCRIYPDGFCAAKAAATSISLHGKDLRWDVAFTRRGRQT